MRLHPRHHIDIEAADLGWALAACGRSIDPADAAHSLEHLVDPRLDTIATLSVRSGLDLLLSSLALPAGSEVLLSALTIPDMARVVRAHGLVPVPVDVDAATLSPRPDALERAWSPRARVLVAAQLLGARPDLTDAIAFCRERSLLLVDDDAQGYAGPDSLRRSQAEVVFHSFGSIKTSTCLGGALVRVRDPALREAMRRRQRAWPVQATAGYARKLALHGALLGLRHPAAYGLFAGQCDERGPGLDQVVMGLTRGFPADDLEGFLGLLRRRPCGALLALMARRLRGFDGRRVARRAEAGEAMLAALAGRVAVLGERQGARTHWLMAVLVDRPASVIPALRRAGFDGARGATSITAIAAPPERPGLTPHEAERATARLLFVPVYPEIPDRERAALAARLVEFRDDRAPTR